MTTLDGRVKRIEAVGVMYMILIATMAVLLNHPKTREQTMEQTAWTIELDVWDEDNPSRPHRTITVTETGDDPVSALERALMKELDVEGFSMPASRLFEMRRSQGPGGL